MLRMLAVAPLVLHPRFVFPTREAVSPLLGQKLTGQPPSAPPMLGTTSRARSNLLSTLDGKRLPAVAFNYDALGAPPVEGAHLHSLHLVVRFDMLNNLRHRLAGPFLPPAPFLFPCSSPQAVRDAPETLPRCRVWLCAPGYKTHTHKNGLAPKEVHTSEMLGVTNLLYTTCGAS